MIKTLLTGLIYALTVGLVVWIVLLIISAIFKLAIDILLIAGLFALLAFLYVVFSGLPKNV